MLMIVSNMDAAAWIGLIWFFAFAQLGLIIRVIDRELFWLASGFIFGGAGLGIFAGAVTFVGIFLTGSYEVTWMGTADQYFREIGTWMVATIAANIVCLPFLRWLFRRYM